MVKKYTGLVQDVDSGGGYERVGAGRRWGISLSFAMNLYSKIALKIKSIKKVLQKYFCSLMQ